MNCPAIFCVIFGVVCFLLSVALLVQGVIFDDPLKYYNDSIFREFLLEPRYMMIWCLATGALGTSTSLLSVIFTFACSSCGLPLVIVFNIICILSSLGMAGVNTYSMLQYKVEGCETTPLIVVVGGPFLAAFLYMLLLLFTVCTRKAKKRSKFFDL